MSDPAGDRDMPGGGALERLRGLVELESPSRDEARLRAVAADFAAQLTDVGAQVETVEAPGVGEHVIGRLPGLDADARSVLILGHLDTVHPVGTFDPVFRVEDGRARGPGVFDMKGGMACVLEALSRFRENGRKPARPVVVLATCDEETGSDTSRAVIEALAADAHAVLVPEPPLPGGAAKTRRKGVSWYRLDVRGRASHAGLEPEAGVNAIVELAHQVLAITGLGDPEAGTSVSVCQSSGGTASNVIPAAAYAVLDVRFATGAEAERVDAALRALAPRLPGAEIALVGGVNRPPMERTPALAALYQRARSLAEEDGWRLDEGTSGGASDGSFTAGMGVPTLDGIGPRGGGAHSLDEHVEIEDLGRRVTLYARLLETL